MGQIAALAESSALRLSANISVLGPAEWQANSVRLQQIVAGQPRRPRYVEYSITTIKDEKQF